MAQYARPASDISVGDWTPPPLHEKVGGVTPDDGTSIHALGVTPCTIALSPITTPGAGDITIRARYRKATAIPFASLAIELRENAALIARRTFLDVADSLVTSAITLTPSERDDVADWAALSIRLIADTIAENAVTYDGELVTYDGELVTYDA